MGDSYSDDLFPFPVWLILLLLFYITLMIGMSIEVIIGIVGILTIVIIALWNGFYKVFLKKKIERWKVIKNKHLEIINNNLRINLDIANIHYSNFSVEIMIKIGADVYNTIQNSQELRWALQHLRKYKTISSNWKKANNLVNQLKSELCELKEYSSNKIKNELGDEYIEDIEFVIGSIVTNVLENEIEHLDKLNFNISDEDIRFAIDFNSHGVMIPKKKYNEDNILKFLNNTVEDDNFRNKIEKIQGINNVANDKFNNFKLNLKKMIMSINNGIVIKGKCKGCISFWKF
jgi:hypothetical protein